jgi:hypothetical protein
MFDIDLTRPPFNVRPAPIEIIKEENTGDEKHMLLLDVEKMYWDEVMV